MLLYDWKTLKKVTNGRSKEIIHAVNSMILKQSNLLPRSKLDKRFKYYYKDLSGHDFLVNAPLLMYKRYFYSAKEIGDYIALASYRNLADYLITKDATLDADLSPLGPNAINSNRLLRLEDGRVHFLYEDYIKGE